MFKGNDIEQLVKLFNQRGVFLYHACQLADLQSYLSLGGIPSRACLENSLKNFTKFDTDDTDKANEVWGKVFVNLSDFGTTFAKSPQGDSTVPNPYGPILLKIRPEALLESLDVAICLRSAGAKNFNREADSLTEIKDVERLFVNRFEVGSHKNSLIKFRQKLKQEFPEFPWAADPEISCTFPNSRLPFSYVDSILVDPYIIKGNPLTLWMRSKLNLPNNVKVRERECLVTRKNLLNDLVIFFDSNKTSELSLQQPISNLPSNLSQSVKNWIINVSNKNLKYQFNRFIKYLYNGTFLFLDKFLYEEAIELYELEQYEECLSLLDSITDKDSPKFYQLRGFTNAWIAKYQDAINDISKAAELINDDEYYTLAEKCKNFLGQYLKYVKVNKEIQIPEATEEIISVEPWIEHLENWYESEEDLYEDSPESFGYIDPYDLRQIIIEAKQDIFNDELTQLEVSLYRRMVLADRETAINQVLIEMNRIGWNTRQGKEYLLCKFGKSSRRQLEKEELIEFLLYLKEQPTKQLSPYDDIAF